MIEIIIPAYNCHDTLSRALASLEAQTDNRFTVTVVDDCSTVPLRSTVEKYSDMLDIKYIRNEKNIRCGMSRQTGVDRSDADYVMFLDADDILMPYAVKVFYDAIEKKPDADIYYAHFYVCKDGKMRTLADKTHCHGKLYKRSFLKEYKIQASPLVKYSDDSYFNSQCFELSQSTVVLKHPIYIWMRNESSVTYSKDFKTHYISDFIHAMTMSVESIMQYKPLDKITFIDGTILNMQRMYEKDKKILSHKEKAVIRSKFKTFEKLTGRKINLKV